jgi:hypothetical protein
MAKKKTFDNMFATPTGQKELLDHLAALTAFVRSMPVVTTCPSCDYYADGFCEKHKAQIPEEHLTTGCGHWTDPIEF